MNKLKILEAQLETDLKFLIDDIKSGYYDDNPEEFKRDRDRIVDKAKRNNMDISSALMFSEMAKGFELMEEIIQSPKDEFGFYQE